MSRIAVLIDDDPQDGTHFRVSLNCESSGGFVPQAWSRVPRPLPSPDGLDGDLADLIRSQLSSAHPDVETLERIGCHLWRLVFDGPVGQQWRAARPERTLLDVRSAELQPLPWEMLQDDTLPVFAVPDRPFVLSRIDAPPPTPLSLPLRVLVVVGDPADETIGWAEEVAALEVLSARRPDRFHVEVLQAPDLPGLDRAGRELQPHVLHVIAHGEVVAGEASLRMEAASQPWQLNPAIIGQYLPQTVRVAFLNACHSGDTSAIGASMTLGGAFRAQGAEATICMQGPVQGRAAGLFSAAFYDALLDGRPLDAACAQGRRTVGIHFPATADRWLPTMQLSVAPGPVVPPPSRLRVAPPHPTIDRSSERRRILFALDPPGGQAPGGQAPGGQAPGGPWSAVLVRGAPSEGKTCLAASVGQVLRAAGRTVRYVSLAGTQTRGWLDVLRAVRGTGGLEQSVFDELPAAVFRRFNQGVNAAARGNPLPAELPAGPVPDELLPIGPQVERTLDHVAVLFEVFRAALADAAAAGSPSGQLLLILDQFETVAAAELPHLVRGLLLPIARGEVPGVQLLVAVQSTAVDPLRELGLAPLCLDVPVLPPPEADFARLAAVYRDVCITPEETTVRAQYDEFSRAVRQGGGWRLPLLPTLLEFATRVTGR